MSKKCFIIVFLFSTYITNMYAQQKTGLERKILWKAPFTVKVAEDELIKQLTFQGAKYHNHDQLLPSYSEVFDLPEGATDAVFRIENTVFEPLVEADFIKDNQIIANDLALKTFFGYESKSPLITLSFIPLRKNINTGSIEKLVAFTIAMTPSYASNKQLPNAQRVYAGSSVLAAGDWYKVTLTGDGVYKLSKSFLSDLGITTAGLNPNQIRVFGNGGGMVPRLNSLPRKDDLTENAVEVFDLNQNGSFDDDDYIIFYGQGPDRWSVGSDGRFHHQKHLFAEETCYFIATGLGNSKTLTQLPDETGAATDIVSSFDDYLFHETDLINFIKSGNEFYGESFDVLLTQEFSNFIFPDIDLSSPIYVQSEVAARSFVPSSFTLKYNGQTVLNQTVNAVSTCFTCAYASGTNSSGTFVALNGNISFSLTYNQPSASSQGWLNFLEVNVRRNLVLNNGLLLFRDKKSVGPGKISKFNFSNVSGNISVWDITDPTDAKAIALNSQGNSPYFLAKTDSLRQFIAFDGSNYKTPTPAGKIQNQNLHSMVQTDMVIVTHPDFITQSNQLADFHRTNDNLRVQVVTTNQVYNEFSSGSADICGIRDFVKMFYDRAQNPLDAPRYLLLFGDGSYNNKGKSEGNTNFIPTFQTDDSYDLVNSYVSDDYFGFLDNNEGLFGPNNIEYLDIGIGRFPVKNATEAQAMVNKVIAYSSVPGNIDEQGNCITGKCNPMGDWRNTMCFIGDDEDSSIHLDQSDDLATYIDTTYNNYNIDKIYLDAYPEIATPGGQRYPAVKELINRRVEKGALLINYTGHGGELGLAHERVLEVADITSWENGCRMPIFMTATCEFSRFDDPDRTSAGELVLLKENGGGIALFTTVRLSYSNSNYDINFDMFKHLFDTINGELPRIGDIFKLSKRENATVENTRNYSLLGDPAVKLSYPKYKIETSSFNNKPVTSIADTIRALSKVTINGFIKDNNGNKITSFNGVIYPTIYDKVSAIRTLGNNPSSYLRNFTLQKNILYKGKVSVVNGDFTFTFIVPKDIAYQFGKGRISYYALDGTVDASGNYENFFIGGVDPNGINDATGPQIKLYMNDEKFVSGGITNESPKLFALVSDSSGINTVGNGIGHDITAQLDNKTEQVYLLNDYYEAELNSYQKGKIVYSLENLTEGHHSLKLKVWDINNNSSEMVTEFVVASSAGLALNHVLNYPNPFTTQTTFYFEHNKPCVGLQVQVQVFTVTGKLIKTINENVQCEGFLSNKIKWDGRDDFGDQIAKGVYIYNLKVKAPDGTSAHKLEKLVVLK